jgi:hypothetical protein
MALSPNTLTTMIDRLYTRQLVDNFFLGSPLWNKLSQNEDPVSGGRQIVDQISYANSYNAGVWGGGINTLPAAFIGHATEAAQPPAFYYFSVAIPETDEIQNQDPAQIINIVEAQFELAQMSLRDTLGADIYGDGSLRNGFQTLMGLKAAITYSVDPGTPTAVPYAGITRVGATGSRFAPVGNAFWNSNAVALSGGGGAQTRWKGTLNYPAGTTIAGAGVIVMQNTFSFCTVNNEAPDLMTASQLAYNAYYGTLTQLMRQATADDLGKQGFTGLLFNNTPLIQDDYCDNDSIYFINSRVFKLRPYEQGNFRMTGWRQPADQLVNLRYGIWMGNATCTRPNLLGRLSGITG